MTVRWQWRAPWSDSWLGLDEAGRVVANVMPYENTEFVDGKVRFGRRWWGAFVRLERIEGRFDTPEEAMAAAQVDEMSHAIHVLIDRLEQVDAGWETAVGRARHHFAVGLSLWGVGS